MLDAGFTTPRAFTYEETGQWIKNHIGIDIAPWSIHLKGNGEVIGWGGIAYCADDAQPQAELLYPFKRKHLGKGYATELAAAAIAYGFSLDRITFIEATTDQGNAPSVRVVEKVGMLRSGVNKASRLIYSITKPIK